MTTPHLNELEAWIVEVAANDPQRPHIPADKLFLRDDLVRVLRPANTDARLGITWGREEEKELDDALRALLDGNMLAKMSMLTPDAVAREEQNKVLRRLAALEGGYESPKDDVVVNNGPYKITWEGRAYLRSQAEADARVDVDALESAEDE